MVEEKKSENVSEFLSARQARVELGKMEWVEEKKSMNFQLFRCRFSSAIDESVGRVDRS